MPFSETPTRSEADLKEFFETNLKARIESDASLKHAYQVRRSDDTFNITEQIIRDVYQADIVLADLSGLAANPNVMYELGVRLALTNKPVILFREKSPDNRRIFDIQGFFAFEYLPTRYRELEDHIVAKIRKFESGAEAYESPVLAILRQQPSVVRTIQRDRAAHLLRSMRIGITASLDMSLALVRAYLLQKHQIELSWKEDTVQQLITRIGTADLDWTGFSFSPRLLPSLHNFLAESPLVNLLPADAERSIGDNIVRYYGTFFSLESIWSEATSRQILHYLFETRLLGSVLEHVEQFLRSDPPEDTPLNDALAVIALSTFASPDAREAFFGLLNATDPNHEGDNSPKPTA